MFDRKELFLTTTQREPKYLTAASDNDQDDGGIILTPSTSSSTPTSIPILTPNSNIFTPLHTPGNEPAPATTSLGCMPAPSCICGRTFRDSSALLRHMMSPAHAMRIHRVPEFAALGRKERVFKILSGVFQSAYAEECR
jgi:hypothetical protein